MGNPRVEGAEGTRRDERERTRRREQRAERSGGRSAGEDGTEHASGPWSLPDPAPAAARGAGTIRFRRYGLRPWQRAPRRLRVRRWRGWAPWRTTRLGGHRDLCLWARKALLLRMTETLCKAHKTPCSAVHRRSACAQ